MSGTSIAIEVQDADVTATLAAVAAKVGDLTPLNQAIGAAMVTATQRRFETQTAPDGTRWRALAPRTARERVKHGRDPNNILRNTNRLYSSLTYQADGSMVAWGTNVVYAAPQQFGATISVGERTQTIYQNYDARHDVFDPKFRPKHASNFARDVKIGPHTITIPARPFLGINDDDVTEIQAIGYEFLAGGTP